MSFHNQIRQIVTLDTDMVITSSIALADITDGTNTFKLAIAKAMRFQWILRGVFTLGATGGFKFLAHNTQASSIYNAEWFANDFTTPAPYGSAQVAEANFANAAANAVNLTLRASGLVVNGATAGIFSIQAAQNSSDVLSMTIHKGATLEIVQF